MGGGNRSNTNKFLLLPAFYPGGDEEQGLLQQSVADVPGVYTRQATTIPAPVDQQCATSELPLIGL